MAIIGDERLAAVDSRGSYADLALVDAVRDVCQDPKFIDEAVRADIECAESLENVRALAAVGLSRAAIPKSHGGGGMDCMTFAMVQEEIGAADPSSVVVWNMHLTLLMYVSLFPPFGSVAEVLADVRDSNRMCCGGFSAPLGELDVRRAGFVFAEDGDDYVVSGRAGFATGSERATYYFFAGRRDPAPAERTALVAAVRIDEPGITVQGNWNAIGLRGTASNDVVLDGLRVRKDAVLEVPAEMLSRMTKFVPPDKAYILQMTNLGLMGGMVGVCRALRDALVSHLEHRFGRGSLEYDAKDAALASSEAWAHHRLGVLEQTLAATRVMVHDCARQVDQEDLDPQELQRLAARTLMQAKGCIETFVVGASHLGGAHGYAAASPLSRFLRDALGFNAMVWRQDELAIDLGRSAFGHDIHLAGIGGT
ncbi:MAG: acyl-CoA dehydrogenase family protein [Solirubrobacteraceae bacterium]